jgi:hypothetical protein
MRIGGFKRDSCVPKGTRFADKTNVSTARLLAEPPKNAP